MECLALNAFALGATENGMSPMNDQTSNIESKIKQPDEVKLEAGWKKALTAEFKKDYMVALRSFLKKEIQNKKTIYPKPSQFFAALDLTPLDKVKVVILGQDPYHGPNQAHGLCFSVQANVPPPPSLVNIFKELKSDLGISESKTGCLDAWAKQGVLLLNATLSVEAGKAGSHQGRGWEQFTDAVIDHLNKNHKNLVFVLWGSYAQKKGELIDKKRHLVIQAPHPSPLSSYRGFFGSKPFSKINKYLVANKISPIDWNLSPSDRSNGQGKLN